MTGTIFRLFWLVMSQPLLFNSPAQDFFAFSTLLCQDSFSLTSVSSVSHFFTNSKIRNGNSLHMEQDDSLVIQEFPLR